jgi:glycosyltransferase involved in cell wall biosynthesis
MSKKDSIKVVFFGEYNKSEILTGPEKVSKRVFEEYSKVNKTLFIHYFQDGDEYGYFKKLFGCEKTTEVNGSDVLQLGIFQMLYQIFKLNPRIIHILCFNRYTAFLFLLKIFLRVKLFYTMNGIIRHENKFYNTEYLSIILRNIIVENIIMYCSDRIFYLSEFSKNILLIYYALDKTKLVIAKNGLDSCFLDYQTTKFPAKEPNSIVFIGDIDRKEKGFSFLINSMALINTPLRLYIISNSNKLQILDSKYIRIFFLNKMYPYEFIEFIKNKMIVISSSEYDPFNISVLEAISCGMYPILTKQTGLCELIRGFVSASIIDYGDRNALIQIINDVFDNKLDYQLLNDLKLLSWENVLKNYYLPYYE